MPLLHRAWVFQERLMSTRYIHFCEAEIVWECRESLACECSLIHAQDNLERFLKYTHDNALRTGSALDSYWRSLVATYMHLQLTFRSDRLVAIEGLVQQLQRRRATEYVLGVWKDSLIDDLAWFCLRNAKNEPTGTGRCRPFPSWSWAAAGDAIVFDKRLVPPVAFAEILPSADGKSESPRLLHLRGPAKSVHLKRPADA